MNTSIVTHGLGALFVMNMFGAFFASFSSLQIKKEGASSGWYTPETAIKHVYNKHVRTVWR